MQDHTGQPWEKAAREWKWPRSLFVCLRSYVFLVGCKGCICARRACSDPLTPGQKHQERLLPVTQAASGNNSAGLKAVSALTSKSHLIKKVKNTPQGTRNKFQTVTDLKLLMRNTVWSDFTIQPRNGVAKVQGGSKLSNMCDLTITETKMLFRKKSGDLWISFSLYMSLAAIQWRLRTAHRWAWTLEDSI